MLMICALGWIMGISMIGYTWEILPKSSWILCAFLFVLVLVQWRIYTRLQMQGFRLIHLTVAFLLSVLLGYQYADLQLRERLVSRQLETKTTEIIVHVAQLNQLGSATIQQPLTVLSPHQPSVKWLGFQRQDNKQQHTPLELGAYYRLKGKVRAVHGYAVDGVFDQEKWYLQQNYQASFQIQHAEKLQLQQLTRLGYQAAVEQHETFFLQWRIWIEKKRLAVRHYISEQPFKQQGLLLALLTGDESLLSSQLEDDFQRYGMSHLLVISGPHVLIFAGLFCWCLQRIINKFSPSIYLIWARPYVMSLPFLICVALYCAFVGFEIPALRTLLICLCAYALLLFKQPLYPFRLLLCSASLLLLFDPFSILSAAFWLSYGACFILLRIYQTIHDHQHQEHQSMQQKTIFAIKVLVDSQWKIFVALLPLSIIFFKQVAWVSPLTNLVAIPWLGLLVVPLDVVAGLSFFVYEPLAGVLFQVNDLLLQGLIGFLKLIDQGLSPQLIYMPLSREMICSLGVGLVILFLPRNTVPKIWGILCFLPVFFADEQRHHFEFHVLDVGQGQSIFVRQQHHSLLVDTGGSYNETQFSLAKQILLPFFAVKGQKTLEQVILTHLDQDHSGAYEKLEKLIKIEKVMSNEKIQTELPFQYCYRDKIWNWQQVEFRVLYPRAEDLIHAAENKNEYSCVLYIRVKDAQPYEHFLIMGDSGWQTEYAILKNEPNLPVDVLILGHHGSKNSSAYDFLAHYRPKLAIASAGHDNSYGHPSRELQARLKALNIPLWTTNQHGTLRFVLNDHEMQLERQRERRLWLRRDEPD